MRSPLGRAFPFLSWQWLADSVSGVRLEDVEKMVRKVFFFMLFAQDMSSGRMVRLCRTFEFSRDAPEFPLVFFGDSLPRKFLRPAFHSLDEMFHSFNGLAVCGLIEGMSGFLPDIAQRSLFWRIPLSVSYGNQACISGDNHFRGSCFPGRSLYALSD